MSFQKIDHEDTTRPEGRTCILVYGYDKIALSQIDKYAASIGALPIVEIKPEHINDTLGTIIEGASLKASAPKDSPLIPTIVLNAVSNAELNAFVHNFKNLGLARPLFAMVTETSIKWSFKQLVADLMEERAMFMKMQAEKQSKENA